MTAEIIRDIGNIYDRIFDHKPFLSGEIAFFLHEFEERRRDREVENLFSAIQTTAEVKTNTVKKCENLCESNLLNLQQQLDASLKSCEEVLSQQRDPSLDALLENNRQTRKKAWQVFVDDMTHKCSRIDLTFEEKEEELVEFYSDLERKLHIHK
ncbi:unnamed protein product [Hermetia illucens]|uniref:Biogenesis of lysosome-related organelles complex 1 subunit 5 n=1 Tax=Hermetia illucens TaxID=343691 RepID=A0A7R8UAH6_HERIL|nr:biogenesis of lysosome-related organelles complex 1 subunit 5 [Hermetia illucens]CAD7077135.1 unnamed protein product [Hermetia illucens]